MKTISIILLLLILCAVSLAQCPDNIIRRSGDRLVVGSNDQVIWLRGICIGNYVWLAEQDTSWLYYNHNEQDFAAIAAMGMNVIRFYMNYRTFEEDSLPYVYKQTGWDWLDVNIEWARRHGLLLILNIHVPHGGFQSEGGGLELWTVPENQNRFVALWQAIAERYAAESIIAGYDLLNEPTTTDSIEQWQDLAQRTIDSIRTVDPCHLMVIEPLMLVWGNWEMGDDPATFQFLVDDDNVLYDFHTYRPTEFTFYAEGTYPDSSVIYFPDDLEWASGGGETPDLPPGNSGWSLYDGSLYQVTDSTLRTIEPVFYCRNNPGAVYFDDFVIREYDPSGVYLRDIISMNITSDSGWAPWSMDGSGSMWLEDQEGHGDSVCLTVAGAVSIAGWAGWSLRYPVQPNHFYAISGWVKGVDVGAGSSCGMRIDFHRSPSGQPVRFRDRDYLEYHLRRWRQFGIDNNVPMYVGEFGTDDSTFNGLGGLNWISDMVDLLAELELNFTYHLYENIRGRQFLIDWFTQHPVAFANPLVTIAVESNSIRLDWQSVHSFASYRIESSPTPSGPWTIITTTPDTTWASPPSSDHLFYRVTAFSP